MTRVALKREYKAHEVVSIPSGSKPHEIDAYVHRNYAVAELPEGDWHMAKWGDKILFSDASNQNPSMAVDKDGKWEVLNG